MKKRLLTLVISTLVLTSSTSILASAEVKGQVNSQNKVVQATTPVKKQLLTKNNVSLTEEMTVKLPKEVTKDKIAGILVQNTDKFVPVAITMTDVNEIKVRPVIGYVGNTKYCLKIFLNDGSQYSMNFTTVSAPRKADIEPNDVFVNASSLNIGETIVGNIAYSNNKVDWYRIDLSKDGILNLDLIHKKGENIHIFLYGKDANNQKYMAEDHWVAQSIRHIEKGLAAGTYYVKIYSDNGGEYELKNKFTPFQKGIDKENDNKFVGAVELKPNSNITGHIGHYYENGLQDKYDWYKLVINKNGTLKVDANHQLGQVINILLYGKDANNQKYIAEDHWSSKSITHMEKELSPGTYYINVNSDAWGSYTLTTSFK